MTDMVSEESFLKMQARAHNAEAKVRLLKQENVDLAEQHENMRLRLAADRRLTVSAGIQRRAFAQTREIKRLSDKLRAIRSVLCD